MAIDSYSSNLQQLKRVRLLYGLLLCVIVVFGLRLFYVQVIRHEHYKVAALSDQLKQYQVPATRGIITAHEGDGTTPLVLNQTLYTVYADPTFIKHPEKVADSLALVLGGNSSDYIDKLKREHTRYVIIAKQVSKSKKQKLLDYKYPGLGAQAQSYRVYPQGTLAAQLLGFVNTQGKGTYGLEQALNKELAGTPGELKAITDVHGVPLAASSGNISKPAVDGDDIGLTIDLPMQKQVEDFLKQSQEENQAQSVSAVVMNANTGAIKAMANYPTYDPAHYGDVADPSVFNNNAVSHPIEIGSIMKTLTTAAALDQGVIKPDTSYYDPASWVVDGYRITNIEEDGGARQQTIATLLNLSLNTGATWELMQMGGGEINTKARNAWHDYMANHYLFGHKTGVEQGYEASGYVPSPKENHAGIDLTYANTAFGQAMTATTMQAAAAMSAVLNGGTYYQPHLVESVTGADGNVTKTPPKVLKKDVVSAQVSADMVPLMQNVINNHHFSRRFDQNRYIVGGKTGTAQIAMPGGGYDPENYNGTYVGFVGGDKVQYVICVFVVKPQVNAGAYAGTAAAQPVFGNIAHMLIDNSYVLPKSSN
jgi:cell division protein FtsI/penicillin-binding protein 2